MKIFDKIFNRKTDEPVIEAPQLVVRPYNGKGCPVNLMDRVTVKLRNGHVIENTFASEVDWSWDRVGFLAKEKSGDIVEFVLHS